MTAIVSASEPGMDPRAEAVADLLIRLERVDARRFVLRGLAVVSYGWPEAVVMISFGDGFRRFPVDVIRLAVRVLRADPPFPASACLADALQHAANKAEAHATLIRYRSLA